MKLIMNADDFGYSRGVNYGIIDAYKRGIVRSTTMMAHMDGFSHGVELAKAHPEFGIGVHLTLTCGRALAGPYQTITDENGSFYNLSDFTDKVAALADPAEVECEFRHQIDKIIAAGITPTHLDSHHHCHEVKEIFPVTLKIAREYGLPIRVTSPKVIPQEYADIKCTDAFIVDFYGQDISLNKLIELLDHVEPEAKTVEVMCHPSYIDQELMRGSNYNMIRTKELEVLTSAEIKQYVAQKEISLADFRVLL